MNTITRISLGIIFFLTFQNTKAFADENPNDTSQYWININPDPNGDPWYVSKMPADLKSAGEEALPAMPLPAEYWKKTGTLPSKIDNSQAPYFRPVFSQSGGSCAQAAGVCYLFTYEANWKRGIPANTKENWYPTHFTWNFLNRGTGTGSRYTDGWKIIMDHGVPNTALYGGSNTALGSNGWMSGYDKYKRSLENKIIDTRFSLSSTSEEGLAKVKAWLYNHFDPNEQYGGLLCFAVNVTNRSEKKIPEGEHEAGKKIITKWGSKGGHAMTIVGYDDNVKWDFNGDNKYTNDIDLNGDGKIDVRDREIGAWKIVNSWGKGYGNGGFIYVPYRLITKQYGVTISQKKYTPRVAMKLKFNYSIRNNIKIVVGAASDTSSTIPENSKQFWHSFTYKGGAHPLRGKGNNEPMELLLDLTDLLDGISTNDPVKYFFDIGTKSSSAVGSIEEMSVVSYEMDPDGMELFCPHRDVPIKSGATTSLSVTLPGNYLSPPLNLAIKELSENYNLSWNKPLPGTFSPKGFIIYKNSAVLDTVKDADVLNYTLPLSEKTGTAYQVSALYNTGKYVVESELCDRITIRMNAPGNALLFDNEYSYAKLPAFFKEPFSAFTVEFYLYPETITDFNQQLGPGWGKFLFHTSEKGEVITGINADDGDSLKSKENLVSLNQWQHFAITYSSGALKLYKDGELEAEKNIVGKCPAWGNFLLGAATPGKTINGKLDELRVWNVARTQSEIKELINSEIANTKVYDGLVAYYNFNETTGKTLVDAANRFHGNLYNGFEDNNRVLSDAFTSPKAVKPIANFDCSFKNAFIGEGIQFSNLSTNTPKSSLWIFEGGTPDTALSKSPVVYYEKPGSYKVKLVVSNKAGSDSLIKTSLIKVEGISKPVAGISSDKVVVGQNQKVSFRSVNPGSDVQKYEWSFEGTDIEKSNSPFVSVTYKKLGTFPVKLKLTNLAGSDSVTIQDYITVIMMPPAADFAANKKYIFKNDTVKFTDKSLNTPEAFSWRIVGTKPETLSEVNPEVNFYSPGTHDVTLEVSNKEGKNKKTIKNMITVSNMNSGNCLEFDGTDDYVDIPDIFGNEITSFTVEFWLYPNNYKDWNQQIGPGWGKFLFRTEKSGKVVAGIDSKNDQRVFSAEKMMETDVWQHFAVTYNKGDLKLYKNGIQLAQKTIMETCPAWNGFKIGNSSENSVDGMIDELRIWNTARSETDIRKLINKEIDNPAEYDDLVAYYNFNQEVDSFVVDRKNNYEGTRYNYSVVGDAWSESHALCAENGLDTLIPYFASEDMVYRKFETKLLDRTAGSPQSWSWEVKKASGDDLTVKNPKVIFENEGKNIVTLTVTNELGTASYTDTVNVRIDTTSPGTPVMKVTYVGENEIKVSCSGSFDNTKVLGYEFFIDGVSVANQEQGTYSFEGLTHSSEYKISALTYDIEGNNSKMVIDTVLTLTPSSAEETIADNSFPISVRTDGRFIILNSKNILNSYSASVYDILGTKLSEQKKINSTEMQFEVNKAGIYILLTECNNIHRTFKLIIK